jgi:hypothetical protein
MGNLQINNSSIQLPMDNSFEAKENIKPSKNNSLYALMTNLN